MAICTMLFSIWTDKLLSFKDKFKVGKFWDHQGSRSTVKTPQSGMNGSAELWSDQVIESIEAIEYLGTTELSDDEITEGGKINEA